MCIRDSFLSNYAQLNIVNDLSRVPGVSLVRVFGQRQYAMRIWINPNKLCLLYTSRCV